MRHRVECIQRRGRRTYQLGWITILVCCAGCARVRAGTLVRSYRLPWWPKPLSHNSSTCTSRGVAGVLATTVEKLTGVRDMVHRNHHRLKIGLQFR